MIIKTKDICQWIRRPIRFNRPHWPLLTMSPDIAMSYPTIIKPITRPSIWLPTIFIDLFHNLVTFRLPILNHRRMILMACKVNKIDLWRRWEVSDLSISLSRHTRSRLHLLPIWRKSKEKRTVMRGSHVWPKQIDLWPTWSVRRIIRWNEANEFWLAFVVTWYPCWCCWWWLHCLPCWFVHFKAESALDFIVTPDSCTQSAKKMLIRKRISRHISAQFSFTLNSCRSSKHGPLSSFSAFGLYHVLWWCPHTYKCKSFHCCFSQNPFRIVARFLFRVAHFVRFILNRIVLIAQIEQCPFLAFIDRPLDEMMLLNLNEQTADGQWEYAI